MSIAIECPGCRTQGSVPEQYAGRQIKCRNCGASFAIPGASEPAPEPEAPASVPESVSEPGSSSSGESGWMPPGISEAAASDVSAPASETEPPAPAAAASETETEAEATPTRESAPEANTSENIGLRTYPDSARAETARLADAVSEPRTEPRRAPNFFRAILFSIFRLLFAAILGGTLYAAAEVPALSEGVMLYATWGGGALLALLFALFVRGFYRSRPGAFPDAPG